MFEAALAKQSRRVWAAMAFGLGAAFLAGVVAGAVLMLYILGLMFTV
jgi:hypothetical protein